MSRPSLRSNVLWLVLCFMFAGFAVPAQAQKTWSGLGGNANWSTNGNWMGNVAPVAGDTVVFGTNTTSTANLGGIAIGQIHFTGSGNSISGAVTINGNASFINILDDADANTISASIAMTMASCEISMTNAGQKLTLTGSISGSVGLVLVGDSTAVVDIINFSGNTYTGATTVVNGILEMNATNGVIIPGNVTVGGGATGTAKLRELQSSDISSTATLTVDSNGTFDLNSHSEILGSLVVSGGSVTLGNTGGLNVTGATMTGGTISDPGFLRIGLSGITATSSATSGATISSPILIAGTTLPISVTAGTVHPELTTASISEISLGATVTKSGTGSWTVTGNNTYKGATTISAGVAEINGSQPLSTILLSGGTLAGTGTVGAISSASGTIAPAAANTGQLASGAVVLSSISNFNVDLINGAFDSLSVGGSVNLGSALLHLNAPATFVRSTPQILLIDNDGTDPIVGTFAGLPEGSAITVGSQVFHISYVGGTGNDVELTAPNSPPQVTTGAAANPSPAQILQSVSFQVAATDPNNDPLTFAWSFGDGSGATGSSTTHTYTAPGTYSVAVSISDGFGGTATSGLSLVVNPLVAVVGQGIDSDGDGFSDSFEIAAGTSPTNRASTPTGQAATASPTPLVAKKVQIKLNFAKANNDSIKFMGTMPIPAGFAAKGQRVTLDIGGIDRGFTLNNKGSAKVGKDSLKFTLIKDKKGKVKAQKSTYTLALNKGSFASALADEGLVGTATVKKKMATVIFEMVFNGKEFKKTEVVTYSAVQGKTGLATAK